MWGQSQSQANNGEKKQQNWTPKTDKAFDNTWNGNSFGFGKPKEKGNDWTKKTEKDHKNMWIF